MEAPRQLPSTSPRNAATTTGTSRKYTLFASDFDEVITEQLLTRVGRRRVSDTLSALLQAMLTVDPTAHTDRGWNTGRHHRIRGANFDLFLKTAPGDWSVRLDAHADALHYRLQAVWDDMTGVHTAIASAPPHGSACESPWRLVDYAIHADVGPLRLTPALLNRFPKRRYGRHGHTKDGAYTWERWGNVLIIYDKTTEILAHPSKAYIEEFWRANGWSPGIPICRVEFRPMRRKSTTLARQTPTEAFRWALEQFCPGPARPKKGARRKRKRKHPAWYALAQATFDPPWAPDATLPVPRVPMPHEREVNQKRGQFLSALANLAALLNFEASTGIALATGVVERLTNNDRATEADLMARVSRARARRGLAP